MSVVLDLLFPRRCSVCGRGESVLCRECRRSLQLLDGKLCARCGAPTAWPVDRCAECAGRRVPFASARAAVAYEGTARLLVAAWKDRGLRHVGSLAGELVAETVPVPSVSALTFVPGDADRVLWRGHNTAEALARELGRRWNLPVVDLLRRAKRVPPQRGLSRRARRLNTRGAFASLRTPPRIALVDDVFTTGATVAAASTELRRSGACSVHVVTFARAVRR